jgi:lipoate-protein ligase A
MANFMSDNKVNTKALKIIESIVNELNDRDISISDITRITIEAMDSYGDKVEFEVEL